MPEEVRKLLAGVVMVVAAVVFFGVWTSYVSSRLVALSPGPGPSTETDRAAAIGQYPLPINAVVIAPSGSRDGIAEDATIADSGVFTPSEGVRGAFRDAGQAVFGSGSGESRGIVSSFVSGIRAVSDGIGSLSASIIQGAYRALSRYVPPNL